MTDFSNPALKQKTSYNFWYQDKIRFADLDALGHASSVNINAYFAGVRTSLFKACIENWPKGDIAPVMKYSAIQYEKELEMDESITVGLKLEAVGNTSFTLMMAVFNSDEDCVALNSNVFVMTDRLRREKISIPEPIKANFMKETQYA